MFQAEESPRSPRHRVEAMGPKCFNEVIRNKYSTWVHFLERCPRFQVLPIRTRLHIRNTFSIIAEVVIIDIHFFTFKLKSVGFESIYKIYCAYSLEMRKRGMQGHQY